VTPGPRPALLDVLARARSHGLLGPGDLDEQIAHARGFAAAAALVPDLAIDLGSGGGLPGLVLAFEWPGARLVLVESSARRARFLAEALGTLDLGDRVEVDHRRAELVGRDPAWRGRAGVVTARSFGPPAVTAECAAPLLRVGGLLVVSEPPVPDPARWPALGMAELGLEDVGEQRWDAGYRVLVQARHCPDRFPRRPGVPSRRRLF
jgi:16S rRNA (guanine527-N7)-methyltransferase